VEKIQVKEKAKEMDIEEILTKESSSVEDILEAKNEMLLRITLRRQVEKLLVEFDETVKRKFSSSVKLNTRRGVVCWMLGRIDEAIRYLGDGSSNVENNYFLGLCYLEKNCNEKADKLLKEAHKETPNSAVIFGSYIESLIRTGQLEEVENLLEKAGKKFGDEPMLAYYKGLYWETLGDYEKAEEEFHSALDMDSEYAPAIFRLAYRYDLKGQDEEAIDLYERLRQIKSLHSNVLINLGLLYEDNGEYLKAIECYNTVLDIMPTHPRANLYLKDAKSSLHMYYDDAFRRKETELKRLLAQPLSEFQIPTRARNCLESLNIKTLGDLVKKTEGELLENEHLGTKTLADIKDLLARRRLSLSTENKRVTLESLLRSYISTEQTSQTDLLNKPIFEIDWSARVRSSLTRLKIYILGDLTNKTENDFLDLPNVGQTSLDEIKRRLEQFGLSLKQA
jgi:DNA-directed RNA polymerase subunit alpha